MALTPKTRPSGQDLSTPVLCSVPGTRQACNEHVLVNRSDTLAGGLSQQMRSVRKPATPVAGFRSSART